MGVQNVTVRLVNTGLKGLLLDGLRKIADPAADGTLTKIHVGLFTAWPGFNNNLATADLTEATFGGYTRSAPVFAAPTVDDEGRPDTLAASVAIAPTDSTASSRCLGVGLYDAAAAGNLLGVGIFDTPETFATPNDSAELVLKIAIPEDAADWGVGALIK